MRPRPTIPLMSPRIARARPLVVSAAVILVGVTLGGLLWTAGLTWSLSADGNPPATALALMWLAAVLVLASGLMAVLIARPILVARARRADRALEQLEALDPDRNARTAASVEQISRSVQETPAQIARSRSQIESRLHTQQRSIDRLIRKMSADTGIGHRDLPRSGIGGSRPTNVFVLGTGRCGTVTFSAACGHFDNYTTGHESRRSEISAARFAYPSHHIESDNRLSWFLGELGRRFDDNETLYVHLTRSPEDVIASYAQRWDSGFRSSIGRAFGHGIVVRTEDWSEAEVESVIRFYVETVTANIEAFLEGRPSMSMQLESIQEQFPGFIDRIGATGDLQAANAELLVKHNARTVRLDPTASEGANEKARTAANAAANEEESTPSGRR